MPKQQKSNETGQDVPYFIYLGMLAAVFWICGMSVYFNEHAMPAYEGSNWSTVQTLAGADGIELQDPGFFANINLVGYLTPQGYIYGIGRGPRFFDEPGLDWIIFLVFLFPVLVKLPSAIRGCSSQPNE